MFTHELESVAYVVYNFDCHMEKEDLSLLRSQTVRYTVKVVTSRKRCKIERLLLYRPQYCPNRVRVVPFQITLSDL